MMTPWTSLNDCLPACLSSSSSSSSSRAYQLLALAAGRVSLKIAFAITSLREGDTTALAAALYLIARHPLPNLWRREYLLP